MSDSASLSSTRANPSVDGELDSARARVRMVAVVVTGLYAWLVTVLPPLIDAPEGGNAPVAWLFGTLALLGLFAGPFLPQLKWGLVVVLSVFVGGAIVSWWLGRAWDHEPPFHVFGTLGWFGFTLALGSLSSPPRRREEADAGPHLAARVKPQATPHVVLGIACFAMVAVLAAAWRVERPAVAVLAHVVALAACLLVLRGSALLATHLQTARTRLRTNLSFRKALLSLVVVLALIALGVAYFLTSR